MELIKNYDIIQIEDSDENIIELYSGKDLHIAAEHFFKGIRKRPHKSIVDLMKIPENMCYYYTIAKDNVMSESESNVRLSILYVNSEWVHDNIDTFTKIEDKLPVQKVNKDDITLLLDSMKFKKDEEIRKIKEKKSARSPPNSIKKLSEDIEFLKNENKDLKASIAILSKRLNKLDN